jgi:hypothetical protein
MTMNPVPPHHFSRRVAAHPRIAVWPHKHNSWLSPQPLALAVVDQLLVSKQVVPHVLQQLETSGQGALPGGPYHAGVIATVFQGLAIKPQITDNYDVRIVKIAKSPTVPLQVSDQPLIFELAAAIRQGLIKAGVSPTLANRGVSPNHVLVPAPANVGCPFGGPRWNSSGSTLQLPTSGAPTRVAVIDSGYQDWWTTSTTDQWGRKWGPWTTTKKAKNQLASDSHLTVHQADYLKGNMSLTAMLNTIAGNTNWFHTSGFWAAGTPDVPCTVHKNVLDALAGHANFVAGVIAQACDMPTLDVWNLNGNFVFTSDDFPCEASVCRALSQIANGTQVANVGFAFPLQAGSSAPLSVLWDTTFQHLGQTTVVAPAGNEAETVLHYPAAFNPNAGPPGTTVPAPPSISPSLYPGLPTSVFANVRGVTSLADSSGAESTFANNGGWVNCSAVGEDVLSTFIPESGVSCEDDLPTLNYQDFSDGLAIWQGSSFAAPKVAAALANQLATGVSPSQAWTNVKMMANPLTADPNYGFKLPTLPPTGP